MIVCACVCVLHFSVCVKKEGEKPWHSWEWASAGLKGVLTLQELRDFIIFHLLVPSPGVYFQSKTEVKGFRSNKTSCMTNGPKSQRKCFNLAWC